MLAANLCCVDAPDTLLGRKIVSWHGHSYIRSEGLRVLRLLLLVRNCCGRLEGVRLLCILLMVDFDRAGLGPTNNIVG